MRPKLKWDTFYMPTADGVYLHNSQGPLKIKGKVVYRWLERLAPYLNGQHTLAEITQGLSEEKKGMVTDLITLLQVNGFIKDITKDLPHTLSAAEEQLYASEIAFIDSFVDSAAYHFEHFRETPMLIIGSGQGLHALVRANLRPGVRQIAVLTMEDGFTPQQSRFAYLDTSSQPGSQQTLTEVRQPCWDEEVEVEKAIQPFDVIISIFERPMLARAKMLNKLCKVQKKILLQAVIVDNRAWIGPLLHGEAAGCWECAWRRLQAHLSDIRAELPLYAFEDRASRSISRFIASPTVAVVANELSFEIFKYLTGAGPLETEQHILSIDLETLEIESHPFLQHPLCTACQSPIALTPPQFREAMEQLELGSPIDQETFSKRVARCFESHVGLFTAITEDDFTQLPLNISQVTVSNPMLIEDSAGPVVISGVGTTVSTARRRATQRACEIYAASVVDQRRLLQFESIESKSFVVQAHWLTGGGTREERGYWTWAKNLHTGQECLVPAPLVYPTVCGRFPSEETAPGLASGHSYAEALSRALLAYCKYLTITAIEIAQTPFAQINLAKLPLSAEGARYRHLLELSEVPLAIYDVTGPLQIPTYAFCSGGMTLTYSSHLDILEAIHDGLEQVLQHYQSVTNHQPEYALAATPHLPLALRGTEFVVPNYMAPADWPKRQSHLQHILHAHGWQIFVIPLSSDPVLTAILPYIVRVLLARP